jgi:NADH:ubiquinone oxidoreductase subunit 2 (subunit N)
VISLYYYAKILKAMFLEKVSEGTLSVQSQIPKLILVMLFVLAVPNLVFGLYWEPLMSWATSSLVFAR